MEHWSAGFFTQSPPVAPSDSLLEGFSCSPSAYAKSREVVAYARRDAKGCRGSDGVDTPSLRVLAERIGEANELFAAVVDAPWYERVARERD